MALQLTTADLLLNIPYPAQNVSQPQQRHCYAYAERDRDTAILQGQQNKQPIADEATQLNLPAMLQSCQREGSAVGPMYVQ